MKRDKHVNGFSRLTHNAKLMITDNHWQFDHHCTTTDFANQILSWNGKKTHWILKLHMQTVLFDVIFLPPFLTHRWWNTFDKERGEWRTHVQRVKLR